MAITHAAVKASGDRGYHNEWNAEHVATNENIAIRSSTRVVAASDSLDTSRADYFCDGTADEVEINQALTDIIASGGQVLLLDGTFNIAASISFGTDHITLRGMGSSTQLLITANTSVIRVSSADHAVIAYLRIRGNSLGAAQYGIYISGNSTNVKIHNCTIEDMGGHGIICFDFALTLTNISVFDCLVDNAGNYGIAVSNTNNALIRDCDVTGAAVYGIGASGSYHSVRSNYVSGSGSNGIDVRGNRCSVKDNISIGNGGSGVNLWALAADYLIVATGNISYNNVQHGIIVTAAGGGLGYSHSVISDNACHDNDSGATGNFDGIYFNRNCDNNTITENACTGNGRNGIRIDDAACDDNVLVANNCGGNTGAGIVDNGTNTEQAHNKV